mmetsp:Transcript_19056/g.72059  ORF Transcript_19056/g.72059 Transcript_19056/m.72059 type:complete len:217 (-) Transcript_19056:1230-1880(-)
MALLMTSSAVVSIHESNGVSRDTWTCSSASGGAGHDEVNSEVGVGVGAGQEGGGGHSGQPGHFGHSLGLRLSVRVSLAVSFTSTMDRYFVSAAFSLASLTSCGTRMTVTLSWMLSLVQATSGYSFARRFARSSSTTSSNGWPNRTASDTSVSPLGPGSLAVTGRKTGFSSRREMTGGQLSRQPVPPLNPTGIARSLRGANPLTNPSPVAHFGQLHS